MMSVNFRIQGSAEHLHQMGRRCWCGHLAVPVRFLSRDEKGNVIEDGKAEERYLQWLASSARPAYVNPPVMEEIKRDNVPKKTVIRKFTGIVKEFPDAAVPKKGRPKKWGSETERKRAYRESGPTGKGKGNEILPRFQHYYFNGLPWRHLLPNSS